MKSIEKTNIGLLCSNYADAIAELKMARMDAKIGELNKTTHPKAYHNALDRLYRAEKSVYEIRTVANSVMASQGDYSEEDSILAELIIGHLDYHLTRDC